MPSAVDDVRRLSRNDIPVRMHALLRGDALAIERWLDERDMRLLWFCSTVIVLACGTYGATFGLWRAPLQAAYSAIKFPLVIFLTSAGNAALNGMLAQLLGTGISFRKSSLAILLSFTIASLILAGCSPLMLFLLFNTPSGELGHAVTLVFHVALIALAGVVANVRLLRLVEHLCCSRSAARWTLFAWLSGNLLLGSQIAWILRPFAGAPDEPVVFLSGEPFRGNFFQAVWDAVLRLLNS